MLGSLFDHENGGDIFPLKRLGFSELQGVTVPKNALFILLSREILKSKISVAIITCVTNRPYWVPLTPRYDVRSLWMVQTDSRGQL
jgi:hypothetical protein